MGLQTTTGVLQLSSIKINEDYSKKWNERMTDFVLLTRDGQPIRETLYRIGGLSSLRVNQDIDKDYFPLMKHVEEIYDDSITKDKTQKRHLASKWCIIDRNGVEKIVFESYKSPYLHGGVIYSLDSNYYNIETGELYCNTSKSMHSEEYLFLENSYDKDKSRRGVMKIHKQSGTYELYPKN